MHPFHLLIIVAIFGAITVLAAAILLTSPVLVPAALGAQENGVKYARDVPLPPPQYYTIPVSIFSPCNLTPT